MNHSKNIYFVVPTWKHLHNPLLHQPYWDMYYATVIENEFKKRGQTQEVKILDFRGFSDEKIDRALNNIALDSIFLYWVFKTPDAIETVLIKDKIYKKFPKSIHIAGGTHIEKTQNESLEQYDSIIVGPGEEQFIKAIDDALNSSLKKIYTQSWSEINFQETPFAQRHFIQKDRLVNNDLFGEYGNLPATLTYFSRGCMYRCSFCTLNTPNMLQVKTPEAVYNEIIYLKKTLGIKALLLKDEIAIHPNRKISMPLLEAIKSAGIIWRGQTVTKNTFEQLELAKDSGCQELAVGVETVDPIVMRNINKHWQNSEQIENFISNARNLGIRIKICLILGLPGEGPNIVDQTIDFIEKNKIEYANVSGLCPLPGSAMYEDREKYGIEYVDETWSKHVHLIHRYSEEEDHGLPFRYDQTNPMVKGRTQDVILDDVKRLQSFLRETGRSY